MNAVFLLGWLVIIVFAALSIGTFFFSLRHAENEKPVDPPLAASAPGAAMTVENGQPPAPVVAIQPPRSGRDETAGEEVAAG
jgi:hypothetical protein